MKQWQKDNPERYIANVRRSQKKNPEKYEALIRKWTNANKEAILRNNAKQRNLGFQPLNEWFEHSNGHHLFLEDNLEFVIFLPDWLHRLMIIIQKSGKTWILSMLLPSITGLMVIYTTFDNSSLDSGLW
jgi:hypothetical protein